MAISFDPAVIEAFFGTLGEVNADRMHDRIHWIDYSGPILKYAIILCIDKEVVNISGDTIQPFGGNSMYEFCVPCTEIVSEVDGYYHDKTCLSFYYGSIAQVNRRMMILKRPDGELKVWPEYPVPDRPPIPCCE